MDGARILRQKGVYRPSANATTPQAIALERASVAAVPIDRFVLSKGGINDVSWTSIDNVDTFQRIIAEISNHVHNHTSCGSVAEWVLCMFNF